MESRSLAIGMNVVAQDAEGKTHNARVVALSHYDGQAIFRYHDGGESGWVPAERAMEVIPEKKPETDDGEEKDEPRVGHGGRDSQRH